MGVVGVGRPRCAECDFPERCAVIEGPRPCDVQGPAKPWLVGLGVLLAVRAAYAEAREVHLVEEDRELYPEDWREMRVRKEDRVTRAYGKAKCEPAEAKVLREVRRALLEEAALVVSQLEVVDALLEAGQ